MRRVPPFAVILILLALAGAASGGGHATARVAIFYYPWYGNPAHDGSWLHWQQDGHRAPGDIASEFYPARGAYSSGDARLVSRQMRDIAEAGVGEVITSWWGRDSTEDRRLWLVRTEARAWGLRVAAHLEPYPGRTIETVRDDLAYLRGRGIRDVFVYDPFAIADDDWIHLARPAGMRLFAQTPFVHEAATDGFDGIYTYDVLTFQSFSELCAAARVEHLLCAPSVGPGFDARRATAERRVRPRYGGATYDWMWLAALRAGPDLVTITSYNEWHEGTQIEPARPMTAPTGYRYKTYNGAYGRFGARAERVYLQRTAYWTARFNP